MRNASSFAALIAVLLVACAAKYERALAIAASNAPAVATSETAPAPALVLLAQRDACPDGICIR